MDDVWRSLRRGAVIVFLTAVILIVGSVRGHTDDAAEPGTSRPEILNHLDDVRKRYGADAALMESALLTHSIAGGSIAEAAIAIDGFGDRDGKRFLTFRLDTGIVFNDRNVPPPTRWRHAWNSIVEKSLRQFRSLSVPADGLLVLVRYAHTTYDVDLAPRAHLNAGPGEVEVVAFYLITSDLADLLTDNISAQQLLDRSTLLINGAPARIVLETNQPTPPGTTD
jgi:hypothetical protein